MDVVWVMVGAFLMGAVFGFIGGASAYAKTIIHHDQEQIRRFLDEKWGEIMAREDEA